MKHTNIAVIEARWEEKSNISVRSLFDLIADIHCDNPNGYHYEMVGGKAAAKEAIPRIGGMKHCKILCIAAHGEGNGLLFPNDERLSRTELRNALNNIKGSQFTGMHLGSCSFGTFEIADYLFREDVNLEWIAGYSKEVSWLESSALDLLFFNEVLRTHRKAKTPGKHLSKAAERVDRLAGGLAKKLGFGLYVRNAKTGGAINLLAANDAR